MAGAATFPMTYGTYTERCKEQERREEKRAKKQRPFDYVPWKSFGGNLIGIRWTGCNIHEMRSMLRKAEIKYDVCERRGDKLRLPIEDGAVNIVSPNEWVVYDKYCHDQIWVCQDRGDEL